MKTLIYILAAVALLALISIAFATALHFHRASGSDEPVKQLILKKQDLIEERILSSPLISSILAELGANNSYQYRINVEDVKKLGNNYLAHVVVSISPAIIIDAEILIKDNTLQLVGTPVIAKNLTYMNHILEDNDEKITGIEDWLSTHPGTLEKLIRETSLLHILQENGINPEYLMKELTRLARLHALEVGFSMDPLTGRISNYSLVLQLVKTGHNGSTKWILLGATPGSLENAKKIYRECKEVLNLILLIMSTPQGYKITGYRYQVLPCISFQAG